MHATFTLIPAAYTSAVSVQVPGFEDIGLLTHCDRLLCDFCSSGQCFAFSFLQIPPRGGHPCRSANRSPCRVGSGLSPPSHPITTTVTGTTPVKALRAMPGAPKSSRVRRLRLIPLTEPYVRASYTAHVIFSQPVSTLSTENKPSASNHLLGMAKLANGLFELRHEFILMNLNGGL
jgi:hypothetical protein